MSSRAKSLPPFGATTFQREPVKERLLLVDYDNSEFGTRAFDLAYYIIHFYEKFNKDINKDSLNMYLHEYNRISEVRQFSIEARASDVNLYSRSALHGNYCTIAIILRAGSRNTVDIPNGVAHLDEKMAIGATLDSFASRTQVREFLEIIGGISDSQTDQEGQVSRYKAAADPNESSEDDLKLRTWQDKAEELELTNEHLEKRLEKIRQARMKI
ncbi:Oidioi.mRNA.OKI2018_I69.chr1.g3923.t1.cds [Oikopleura dioica]|uniref:Oidioi.mRNA.OKI2018_I69.chr1.g3923.t1.cds n=1 Tax=Oikopleura dioica TaxID=34765 RepID=A0ABN7T166_OIKDI|nr:Oidioi.mRNA.OKI2018_I69.chr1.g3923.t1.cds [Oikopleura dioica]